MRVCTALSVLVVVVACLLPALTVSGRSSLKSTQTADLLEPQHASSASSRAAEAALDAVLLEFEQAPSTTQGPWIGANATVVPTTSTAPSTATATTATAATTTATAKNATAATNTTAAANSTSSSNGPLNVRAWNTVADGLCSHSCGKGHRKLKITCINPRQPGVVLPDSECAILRKPKSIARCNNRPCNWETKPTSPCSQPCGKGNQTVANICRDPLTNDVMPAKQCTTEPPPSYQYCSVRNCNWDSRPVGACSSTCGLGTQFFNVSCRDPYTGHRVDDAQCQGPPPPSKDVPCENNACGWRARPIGECSAPCGEGVQKMNVTCEDPITGALIDEAICGPGKPAETQVCHVRECHWHRSMKGTCSSPCGPGIQAFKLSCRNPGDGSRQSKKQCKNVPVPPLSEPCQLHACEWHARKDGNCDQICGPGRQKRKISCRDPVSFARVPKEHCTGKAPSSNTKCYTQACIWSTKPITDCSVTCGAGTQNVNITCTDPTRRFVVPDTQCFDASKPAAVQPCNQQECRWKTSPATACSNTCGLGTQKLNVACIDPITSREQLPGQCDSDVRPADNTTCFVKPCSWISDPPVAKCSQRCGPGHVAVNVTCQDAQVGTVYPDESCSPDPKPPGLLPCQISECIWATNWTDCKKTCGGDFQYTTLSCQHEDGTPMSNTQCKTAPPSWKQCNTQACLDIPEAFLWYNFEAKISGGSVIKNRLGSTLGYKLDGLVQGSDAAQVQGRGGRGNGISLPASSDHTSGPQVMIPQGKALTAPSFSISFWMQLTATPTQGRFYIIVDNRGTEGGGQGFVIYLNPSDGLLYLNDAFSAQLGLSHFADSGVQFPNDGDYHHVTVTYNQQLVRFFIDGTQTSVVDPSHTFQFTVPTSQHSVYLRGSPDKYWRYLPMNLDEFAYFSYPLTKEQIAILAQPAPSNVCAAGQRLTGGGCAKFLTPGDALDGQCRLGAPFDLQRCLQPLWGLNGCSDLGSSYPAASDVDFWNTKSWKELKTTVNKFARRDKKPQLAAKKFWGVCKNRTPSGLDTLCDHPPPYHTSVCLQGLFLELGCSRKASGFPASASHPLSLQLNQLSWRDVKAKLNAIVSGDRKGGTFEGQCHDPTPDDETQ